MSDLRAPVYLTDADVDAVAPSASVLADAVATAFLGRARGTTIAPVKSALTCPGSDLYCQAMPAAIAGVGAGVKWVAVSPCKAGRRLPHVSGTMILGDADTGELAGILEAGRLTALRTAAVSLVAARYLVRPGAAVLTLIGCGVQARSHLDALRSEFPIESVRVFGRRRASVEAFVRENQAANVAFEICEGDTAALLGDVVVSTVPAQPGLVPFLDARKLPEGSTVLAVDLARSWIPDSSIAFDRCYTDDGTQSRTIAASNPTFEALRFEADLADLLSGQALGRRAETDRLCFAFAGSGIADVAVAALLIERAREVGRGLGLPIGT